MYLIADITAPMPFDSVVISSLENPSAKTTFPLAAPATSFTYNASPGAGDEEIALTPSLVVDASSHGTLIAHGEVSNIDYDPQPDGSYVAHVHIALGADQHTSVDTSMLDPHLTGERTGTVPAHLHPLDVDPERTGMFPTHAGDRALQ